MRGVPSGRRCASSRSLASMSLTSGDAGRAVLEVVPVTLAVGEAVEAADGDGTAAFVAGTAVVCVAVRGFGTTVDDFGAVATAGGTAAAAAAASANVVVFDAVTAAVTGALGGGTAAVTGALGGGAVAAT